MLNRRAAPNALLFFRRHRMSNAVLISVARDRVRGRWREQMDQKVTVSGPTGILGEGRMSDMLKAALPPSQYHLIGDRET